MRFLVESVSRDNGNSEEHGALPAAVAESMGEEIADELGALNRYNIAKLDLEPIELLRSMPFFQDIALDDLANIAVRMSMHRVSEGDVITRQGEPGGHMFFINHGVVRVSRVDHGLSRDLATLMAGDFFGEAALLSGERPNATVIAVTECTFYKLHRDDLEVAMVTQPAIRKALEEESRKRSEMHFAG